MRGSGLAAVLLVVSCLSAGASSRERRLHVQVRTTPVRPAPSFLGAPVAELSYGDIVAVVRDQGSWHEVRVTGSVTGWVHSSALTRQRVRVTDSGRDASVAATGDEIAIAGKGFNEDVEAEFRAGDAEFDFTWVDRSEQIEVRPEEIRGFLVSGGLRDPAEGEQR